MAKDAYTFRYRLGNWQNYNQALIAQGGMLFWVNEVANPPESATYLILMSPLASSNWASDNCSKPKGPFFINQIQEWYGSGNYWSYRLWKFLGIYGKNIHPFFTIKPLGKGTGLGFYAVKPLVTKYQGKISVDTEVEKGTTFKLEFPALSQT